MVKSLALLVCLLSSGCYFFFPFNPPPPRKIAAVPGEQIKVKTREVKLYVASCSDDMANRGRCGLRDGKLMRWDPQDYTTLKYNGKDLTYAEFHDLADPDFADERARFKSLNRKCNASLVPSAISVLGIGAAVLYPLVNSGHMTDHEKLQFRIGGGATAVVFGALSYPLGGYACKRGNDTVRTTHKKTSWEEDDFPGGGEDFQKIVDAFNARVRNGGVTATPPTDTPATDTPATDTPPTEDDPKSAPDDFTPGTKPIMTLLNETSELSKFTALLVQTGVDKELAGKGPYTVVALTNRSLAKVQDKLDKLDKAERLKTFRDLVFVGAYTRDESTLKSLGGKSEAFQQRKDGSFKVRGRSGSLRRVGTASNGVVYVLE